MTDPRIEKLILMLVERFPGITPLTGPMPDDPSSGEILIRLLNSSAPDMIVCDESERMIRETWGDGNRPVFVVGVSPQHSGRYLEILRDRAALTR